MATTTDKILPSQFNDPKIEAIVTQLRRADAQSDELKVLLLQSAGKALGTLIEELGRDGKK